MNKQRFRPFVSVIAFLALVLPGRAVFAATTTAIGSYVPVAGVVYVVAEQDNNLFVGTDSGLLVADVRNTKKPKYIGELNTGTTEYDSAVLDIKISGHYAYLALWQYGLAVIDISDPKKPTIVGTYHDPSRNSMKVFLSGTKAYLYAESSAVDVLDVSNPTAPTLLSTYNFATAIGDLAVSGTTMYVTYGDVDGKTTGNTLNVFDISGSTPTTLGVVATHGMGIGLTLDGNTVYIGDNAGMTIIDVSTPASPTVLGNYKTTKRTGRIAVSGDIAYLPLDGEYDMVDVSKPSAPKFVSSLSLNNGLSINPLFLDGSVGYAPLGNNGAEAQVAILDISDPKNVKIISYLSSDMPIQDVALDTDHPEIAYAIDPNMGLHVISNSDPDYPSLIGMYDTAGSPQRVKTFQGKVYIGTEKAGLQVIDPRLHQVEQNTILAEWTSSPKLSASSARAKNVYDMDFSGTNTFLAAGSDGMLILNATDLTFVGQYKDVNAKTIIVSGAVAYVGLDDGTILSLDVSDPTNLILLNSQPLRNVSASTVQKKNLSFAIRGKYLYTTASTGGMNVYSLSRPKKIRFMKHVSIGTKPRSLVASAKRMYIGDGAKGLRIVDITKPTNPKLLKTLQIPGIDVRGIAKNGNIMILSGGTSGMVNVSIASL